MRNSSHSPARASARPAIAQVSTATGRRKRRPGILLALALAACCGTAVAAPGLTAASKSWTLTDAVPVLMAGVMGGTILSGLIPVAARSGLSPLPKPLCVAFLEQALHRPFPLPYALGFNAIWIALWSVFHAFLFWGAPSLAGAAAFAIVLWLLSMLFFFPSVGWGYFGSRIGPLASVDSALSYALFAIVIWAANNAAAGLART